MTDRADIYTITSAQIDAVLDGETNLIAKMATISSMLSLAFEERFFWTGFYLVDDNNPNELVVGPYQGSLGCLRIPFGRGVCGVAASEKSTQIVDDVHAVENHIACDSRSHSEIVVPVFDKSGHLIAVFDVDSEQKSAFNQIDKIRLEALLMRHFTS